MTNALLHQMEDMANETPYHLYRVSKLRSAVIHRAATLRSSWGVYWNFYPVKGLERVPTAVAERALHNLNSGRTTPDDYG